MQDCKFIFTHSDVTRPNGYELIDNRNSELDHRLWSEWSGIYSVMKKFEAMKKDKEADTTGKTNADFPPQWVQTNHYRRIMDPDCVNRTYVANPIILQGTIAQQYAACHFIEDLELMGKAIKECYPNMAQAAEQVLNSNILVPYNIVNCQYGQFIDWATFVITVLKKVAEYLNHPTFETMKEIISKREVPKVEGRNNDIDYQCRVYSFLSERLSTIYWLTCARQIPVFPANTIKDKGVF